MKADCCIELVLTIACELLPQCKVGCDRCDHPRLASSRTALAPMAAVLGPQQQWDVEGANSGIPAYHERIDVELV